MAHGEWLPMLKEIGIDRTMAHRLMKIGSRLSNVANYQHLPSTIFALYELSRMDPDDIEHGIESGAITPDMTIKQARERGETKQVDGDNICLPKDGPRARGDDLRNIPQLSAGTARERVETIRTFVRLRSRA